MSARRISDAGRAELRRALSGPGLILDVGLVRTRVRAGADLDGALQAVYRHFPFEPSGWADIDVKLARPTGLRRFWRPQIVFSSDRRAPFAPFPADTALPLMEWGVNWLIGQRVHDVLLLHAGVVERGGAALVMPALPGSGKSTLTAALSLRGWRLLSDEFGAYDHGARRFVPVLKPIALKNASIEVIRSLAPQAPLGPSFPRTRKGTVAHLAPAEPAVDRRHEGARPGAVVLPLWRAGSATRLERIGKDAVFRSLAFNAFNYQVQGAEGFEAVASLCDTMTGWQLVYSDLGDALRRLDALWTSELGLTAPSDHDEAARQALPAASEAMR